MFRGLQQVSLQIRAGDGQVLLPESASFFHGATTMDTTTRAASALRQRTIDDMRMHKFTGKT